MTARSFRPLRRYETRGLELWATTDDGRPTALEARWTIRDFLLEHDRSLTKTETLMVRQMKPGESRMFGSGSGTFLLRCVTTAVLVALALGATACGLTAPSSCQPLEIGVTSSTDSTTGKIARGEICVTGNPDQHVIPGAGSTR